MISHQSGMMSQEKEKYHYSLVEIGVNMTQNDVLIASLNWHS